MVAKPILQYELAVMGWAVVFRVTSQQTRQALTLHYKHAKCPYTIDVVTKNFPGIALCSDRIIINLRGGFSACDDTVSVMNMRDEAQARSIVRHINAALETWCEQHVEQVVSRSKQGSALQIVTLFARRKR